MPLFSCEFLSHLCFSAVSHIFPMCRPSPTLCVPAVFVAVGLFDVLFQISAKQLKIPIFSTRPASLIPSDQSCFSGIMPMHLQHGLTASKCPVRLLLRGGSFFYRSGTARMAAVVHIRYTPLRYYVNLNPIKIEREAKHEPE